MPYSRIWVPELNAWKIIGENTGDIVATEPGTEISWSAKREAPITIALPPEIIAQAALMPVYTPEQWDQRAITEAQAVTIWQGQQEQWASQGLTNTGQPISQPVSQPVSQTVPQPVTVSKPNEKLGTGLIVGGTLIVLLIMLFGNKKTIKSPA